MKLSLIGAQASAQKTGLAAVLALCGVLFMPPNVLAADYCVSGLLTKFG